jgi:hypothetical protein
MFMVYDDALESFVLKDVNNRYTKEGGARIDLVASLKFIGDSVLNNEQIMSDIQQAFVAEPFKSQYLKVLNGLDTTNAFQQTTDVIFISPYEEARDRIIYRERLSSPNTSKIGVAGAFAGAALILSISGYMIHGGTRNFAGPGKTFRSALAKANGISTWRNFTFITTQNKVKLFLRNNRSSPGKVILSQPTENIAPRARREETEAQIATLAT